MISFKRHWENTFMKSEKEEELVKVLAKVLSECVVGLRSDNAAITGLSVFWIPSQTH